jgi:hypothetical protein
MNCSVLLKTLPDAMVVQGGEGGVKGQAPRCSALSGLNRVQQRAFPSLMTNQTFKDNAAKQKTSISKFDDKSNV